MGTKNQRPIVIRGRSPSFRETAKFFGISKKKMAEIQSVIAKLIPRKLSPKEVRRRSRTIRSKLEELNLKIVELKNEALYTEKEEERWQKQLWKIQLLCPHKNKQSARAEAEARDLPYSRHAWICKDCGFRNRSKSDKECEKELEKLLAAGSK